MSEVGLIYGATSSSPGPVIIIRTSADDPTVNADVCLAVPLTAGLLSGSDMLSQEYRCL